MTDRQAEWRVNFGQGQVHYAGDRAACERFIVEDGDAGLFLERRDFETGDWYTYASGKMVRARAAKA